MIDSTTDSHLRQTPDYSAKYQTNDPTDTAPADNGGSTVSSGNGVRSGDTASWEGSALHRNFMALAAHQVLMRTGWIFKTESIVMPAVLDSIAGAGWVRGWLPLLNRVGHSIPPLLLARRVKIARRKGRILFSSSALMGALFLLLGFLFVGGGRLGAWMPLTFLGIYTAFFMCTGLTQLSFGTLQAKLVPTTRRGRLLLVANSVGALTAVTCAFLLLPNWLGQETPRFDLIFGFSGALFGCSAVAILFAIESQDQSTEPPSRVLQSFRLAWSAWRKDANFFRLTAVASTFGVSMMLFPHYQNLGLRGLGLDLSELVWWVIIQNIGTGVFSIPAGQVADRRGNRLVLKIALLGVAAAPVLAIAFHTFPHPGVKLFPLVFVFVGLTPVVLRTLQNFTLELCPAEDHPRYLSVLAACVSVPMLFSPLVGLLIDLTGFAPVFLGIAGVVVVSWLMTFGLHDPRATSTVVT